MTLIKNEYLSVQWLFQLNHCFFNFLAIKFDILLHHHIMIFTYLMTKDAIFDIIITLNKKSYSTSTEDTNIHNVAPYMI